MSTPNIQVGNIPTPFSLRKIVIDYRNLPICVDHVEDTGNLRKRYVYYHNYGNRIQISIVTIPLFGEPKVVSYSYSIEKNHRISLPRKLKHQTNNFRQYVV